MPFKQFDFSVLTSADLKIYCVGGCNNIYKNETRPQNCVYDIITDSWSFLPVLNFVGIYEKHYQRVSLAMLNNRYLCAFWLSEYPDFIYAFLDTKLVGTSLC